ncbi:MAG: hypothetical protein KAV87_24380 [Desulfobacteraceae bacterium]|nr:hypothetical protein [Desulfobacteraceae bacterium]
MNDAEILKRFEDDLWKSSPHTVSSRTFYARMWLDFAGRPPEQWDRALVIRFLKRLDDEGYAKGTQHNVFWITKRVFDAAQVPWPMGKRGAPKVQASDVVKPALDIDELRVMIETAKHGKLETDQACFLALSTTYGLRREELVRIQPGDVNYKMETVYVRTCKGGIERDQALAAEIAPFLEKHDFNREYSLFDMSRIYLEIEERAGLSHVDGAGWHSPRRTLDTALVQWDYIHCKIFLRWKLTGDMALAYVTLNPLKVDREVFEVHPFLPFWRN